MQCGHCRRDVADYANFCYFCGARQHASPVGRRLMRSSSDCKIAGVCGGIAEYLDVDSTAIRLIWALAFVFTALVPATVAYVIIWLIVPQAPPLAVRAPEAGNAAPHTGSAPAI